METVRNIDLVNSARQPPALFTRLNTSPKLHALRLYLRSHLAAKQLLEQHLPVSALSAYEFDIIASTDVAEIKSRPNADLRLFVNLDHISDIRDPNAYFLAVHEQLQHNGLILGCLETLEIHRQKFFSKYPCYFRRVLYALHFLYARAMPKLPGLKRLHLWLSGKRMLSKAEVLGRLHYCGFKVVGTESDDGQLYFLARKAQPPCSERCASEGFIIRLKRVGLGGRPIYIHKFRTMYPYSEYLQEYVYEQNRLANNGKFRRDFRITDWGKFMRKYWLDELPQLYDICRGKVRLVGVRALSEHYFSLYPAELQELRKQFKPGLIPPYYADLPCCFDEIIASEKRYLEKKVSHDLLTDHAYFLRALYNILFRNARSL